MFESFFPQPKLFLWSAIAWFFVGIGVWYGGANELASQFSLIGPIELAEGERPPFLTQDKAWLYQFLVGFSVLFCIGWAVKAGKHEWFVWSVVGTTIIMLVTYFIVQISVWLNDWYGAFYNMIQAALGGQQAVSVEEYYQLLFSAAQILIVTIMVQVLFAFFTSHYVFRWRTAMNNYYMENWEKLRHVEGAAQRVQEDTMRFAAIVEGLGAAFVRSIMTLIAFLPVLWTLSEQVTELPLIGAIDGSMVFVALLSAAFGTVLLALVGIRLPGLEFNNQKVEAAFRKELVYGEDSDERAEPPTVKQLFGNVRKNYFKLYFNYLYFNVFRYAYLQFSSFIPLIALGPTIVAGVITFGVYRQISNAFSQVENSFQYLVNSWTTIIDLLSIHKRLRTFEAAIDGEDTTHMEASLQKI